MEENEKIIIEAENDELDTKAQERANFRRVLAFGLGKENYCVDIAQAKEVVRLPEITRMPNVPVFAKGIMNLRGDILAVIDIRYFLGIEEAEKQEELRVIVTDAGGYLVGIVADRFSGTVDIEEEKIQPPLDTLSPQVRAFTKGQAQIGEGVFILLDLAAILRCQEIETLRKGE
jgi:purine-binding chemotaxis protein CheW